MEEIKKALIYLAQEIDDINNWILHRDDWDLDKDFSEKKVNEILKGNNNDTSK